MNNLILQVNGKDLCRASESFELETLPLVIHPYAIMYHNTRKSPTYEESRNVLVQLSTQPMLLGIDLVQLMPTLEWLAELAPKGPRYAFLTEEMHPMPLGKTMGALERAIKATFGRPELLLAGAELNLDSEGHLDRHGCVNYLAYNFDFAFDLRILREFCWTG